MLSLPHALAPVLRPRRGARGGPCCSLGRRAGDSRRDRVAIRLVLRLVMQRERNGELVPDVPPHDSWLIEVTWGEWNEEGVGAGGGSPWAVPRLLPDATRQGGF